MRMLILVGLLSCVWLPVADASDQQILAALEQEPARDKSIRRALVFLRGLQGPDGALSIDNRAANASLAIMAHLAAGHTPDDLQLGPWIRRSLALVLSSQDDQGYFGAKDGSRMYGHGICTLMLAEAFGMCRDEELEERIHAALARAVAVTISAARVPKISGHEGGWRYEPIDNAADLSLTGWQLMSLHAARQVGIAVPEEIIANAVDYARRMSNADGMVGYDNPREDHPALRGIALLAMAIGDQLENPATGLIAGRIAKEPIAWSGPWMFYRAYHDSVGLSQAAPQLWMEYGKILESVLIDHQEPDGSWSTPPGDNEVTYGVTYRTAMAVLALAVNKHLLPVYQR